MAQKKISTKAKNKERVIPESLKKKLTDPAFHEYQNELIKLAAPWQFNEPQRLEFKDRLILDRKDYTNYYFKNYIESGNQFDESIFLETLLEIYSEAKHHYFKGYRKFVEHELILFKRVDFTETASLSNDNTFLKTQRQIALYYYYRMVQGINDNFEINATKITKSYGHNSGEKQKRKYLECMKVTERTKHSALNMKDLSKVINELKRMSLDSQKAEKDLNQASSNTEE